MPFWCAAVHPGSHTRLEVSYPVLFFHSLDTRYGAVTLSGVVISASALFQSCYGSGPEVSSSFLLFPSVPVRLATDTYSSRFRGAVSGFVSAWYFTLPAEAGVILGQEVQRWVHISSSVRVPELYSVL